MQTYLKLQLTIINRKIIDFGIPLLIGYISIPFLFILLSHYLFEKTEFAHYIFGLTAIGLVSKLSEPKRNDFLKSIFTKKNYRKIRIIENVTYCLPFSAFLVYNNQFLFVIILNLFVIIITLFNFNTNIDIPIPTPFSRKPFEFTIGFRKTFCVFPIAYLLTYISISVENFNLGIFSVLLVGITCFSYYLKMENEYFVWNYNLSSKEFLTEKSKNCLIYFSLLVLPIIIALGISSFSHIDILIAFILLCYLYLITIIFAKYTSFPNEMDISQGILIAASFMFPPLLLIFIPLFYSRSIKKLNKVLND